MNSTPLRALPFKPAPAPTTLAGLIRPEFQVDLYLPPRDNAYLYGSHCSVEGCERPGNERIVLHARLCQRHAQRYVASGASISDFLSDAPLVAARTPQTGKPRYALTSDAPRTRDELRFLLQSLHDGVHDVTFSSKRWNALRAVYGASEAQSLRHIDLTALPQPKVATSSARRFQRYLEEVTTSFTGHQPSRRDDVWTRALYGHFAHSMQGRPPVQMDFTVLRQAWLREAAKDVAWQRMTLASLTPSTAWDMVVDVIRFAEWAGPQLRGPETVTRSLLIDWLAHNRTTQPPRSVSQRLSRLRLFIDHARVSGVPISPDATYLPGELAIRTALDQPPRYFDDHELAQLDAPENQAKLNDYNRRAYQVLRRTGMRQRSLVHLPYDCLSEAGGAFYLRFFNTKNRGAPVEHTIPIAPELATVVREQQQWARDFWPAQHPTWLFPARNTNPTGSRPAHVGAIYNVLVAWVKDCGITGADGRQLHFWPHRLRHTLGTQMINDGVPQNVIQQYYGHASPEMTAHYAKLHDRTVRREFDAFQDRVNRRGERVEILPPGISTDAVLLNERIGRAKQSLPNGYCGIPIQQTCPHPNACLSCDAFLTDETFRPALSEQRERAQAMATKAGSAGRDRQEQLNLADVAALDAVITGLDALKSEPDPAFDLRDATHGT